MAGDAKYYWLKLKKDFFKRHDMRIIEAQENGKEFVLIYLKLLCESIDHEGALRFSETIPYTTKMLAAITDTSEEALCAALDMFVDLGLVSVDDDRTIYMNNIAGMIGSATDNDNASRQRRYRERQKEQALQESNENVTGALQRVTTRYVTERNESVTERYAGVTKNNESIDIDKDKDIEIEIDKDKECIYGSDEPTPAKDTKHKHGEYKKVLLTDSEYDRLVTDYGQEQTEKAITFLDAYIAEKGYKSKSHNLALRRWVFNAVKEHEQKQRRTQGTAEQLDDFYNMMSDWAKEDGQ